MLHRMVQEQIPVSISDNNMVIVKGVVSSVLCVLGFVKYNKYFGRNRTATTTTKPFSPKQVG
jgi:hypothetical protein